MRACAYDGAENANMKKTILTSLAALVLLAGCDKDDLEEAHENIVGPDGANTVVAMSMAYTHNGAAFDTSMTLTDAAGAPFKLDRIRFYMGGFSFTDDLDSLVAAFPEKYLLVDLWQGGAIRNIGQLNGHLHEMSFGLGVDSVLNHTDPSLVSAPLGVNGMFWTWAQGYLFLTVEGRYDSDSSGTVDADDLPLSYHCGMDTLYTPVELHVHTDAEEGGDVVLPLALNIDTLMAHMNIRTWPVEHTVTPVTAGLMHRLAVGLTHVE